MKNWANQVIERGSIVWRGAREGNTSGFKIGTVLEVNEDKGTARVHWQFEPGFYWFAKQHLPDSMWRFLNEVRRIDSKGAPSVDTLAVVDVDLRRLGEHADIWRELTEHARAEVDTGR